MDKPIVITLPEEQTEARIYVLADLHLGDQGCDWDEINRTLDAIADDENAKIILAGDVMNNATKTSVSDVYSESISPMEQLNRAADLLRPVAPKVIACTSGNHEERTYRQDGIDLSRLLSRELKFEDKYRPDFAVIYLRLGHAVKNGRQHLYSMYVNHGNGGGRKIGGKANRLNDLAMICDADIFVVGHTHTPITFKDRFLRMNPSTNTFCPVERTYVNTTGWLEYRGYGARQGYVPSAVSCPVIKLSGVRKQVRVEL